MFIGMEKIILVLVVALLLLGPQQMPEIGKQIGKLLRDFRNMSGDVQRALDLEGHHDYDTSYSHSTSYSNGFHPNTPGETPTFAYSAPTQGIPVAAIGAMSDGATAGEAATAGDDTSETRVGARVYNEPAKSNAEGGAMASYEI